MSARTVSGKFGEPSRASRSWFALDAERMAIERIVDALGRVVRPIRNGEPSDLDRAIVLELSADDIAEMCRKMGLGDDVRADILAAQSALLAR